MGHHHLREDNECENCGYTVDIAYCSRCGQKNTETRQSFSYLFTHFIEDFTHYDGAFWKTIKYLLFRPGRLTIEYLQGYRQRYVPPVKLYIFISFACFLLLKLFSLTIDEPTVSVKVKHNTTEEFSVNFDGIKYTSAAQLDSIQNTLPKSEKMHFANYWIIKKRLEKGKDVGNIDADNPLLIQELINLLPKALFFYMPLFAFWLWLFHGKRRWYFFDHGIFTLHYFSFLLLLYTIEIITELFLSSVIPDENMVIISVIMGFTITAYAFFYFFRAHRRMYGESKFISRLKSLLLFFINLFCISIVLLAIFLYISFII